MTDSNNKLIEAHLVTEKINDIPGDPDRTDWVARIAWEKTFARENASRKTQHYIATLNEIKSEDRLRSLRKTFSF